MFCILVDIMFILQKCGCFIACNFISARDFVITQPSGMKNITSNSALGNLLRSGTPLSNSTATPPNSLLVGDNLLTNQQKTQSALLKQKILQVREIVFDINTINYDS